MGECWIRPCLPTPDLTRHSIRSADGLLCDRLTNLSFSVLGHVVVVSADRVDGLVSFYSVPLVFVTRNRPLETLGEGIGIALYAWENAYCLC